MSIEAINHVLNRSRSKGTTLLVALVLADHWNRDHGYCWPNLATIARRARCTRRAAQKCLRNLEDLGEWRIHYNAGDKGQHHYFLNFGAHGPDVRQLPVEGEQNSPPRENRSRANKSTPRMSQSSPKPLGTGIKPERRKKFAPGEPEEAGKDPVQARDVLAEWTALKETFGTGLSAPPTADPNDP